MLKRLPMVKLSFETFQSKHFKESRCFPWNLASLACYQQTKRNPLLSLVTECTPWWRERGWEWMKRWAWKLQFAAHWRAGTALSHSSLKQPFVASPAKGALLAWLNAMKGKQEASLNAANNFNSLWIYPYSNQSSNNSIKILITQLNISYGSPLWLGTQQICCMETFRNI